MRYPKLRELREAVKALVKGPYTLKFPKEPSIPPEAFRGKPEFDEKECIGCGACAEVCPAKAIDIVDEVKEGRGKRKLTLHLDLCIFCGQCQANCLPEKGVTLTNEYDLATTDRKELIETVEKDLALCEICGAVIGAVDHIRWVAEKVGPAAFSNPTLMLTLLKKLDLAEIEIPKPVPLEPKRADRIRVLCPKCRRQTSLEMA